MFSNIFLPIYSKLIRKMQLNSTKSAYFLQFYEIKLKSSLFSKTVDGMPDFH